MVDLFAYYNYNMYKICEMKNNKNWLKQCIFVFHYMAYYEKKGDVLLSGVSVHNFVQSS